MRHFYVHIPYCRQKCNYCGFYSVPLEGASPDVYFGALMQEIILMGAKNLGSAPNNIRNATAFFGGGTPSLFKPEQIYAIINEIQRDFRIKGFREITLEGNPESLYSERLLKLHSYGIHRISIGVQSLNDKHLQFLGRIHNAQQAISAIQQIKSAGFEKISADLIYGIPGMSSKELCADINKLIEMGIQHISLYSLTLEPQTPLADAVAAGSINLPSTDESAGQYAAASELLNSCGFVCYELSNFAQPGHECLHNLACWHDESYIGFGAAAHSFDGICRWANTRSIEKYAESLANHAQPFDFIETLSPIERFEETIMLGLRLQEGFSISKAVNISGGNAGKDKILSASSQMLDNGILILHKDKLALSPGNRLLADGVAAKIIEGTLNEANIPGTRSNRAGCFR